MTRIATLKSAAALSLALLVSACASSGGNSEVAAQASHDGLQLVSGTKFSEVYQKPGADLSEYSELGVEPCQVAFKNNWMRRQNEGRVDLSNRVTQQDVDRIKDQLGESCDRIFNEALLREPAYTITDNYADGERVLVLKPSIINLDINAPDLRSTTRTRSYTTSAGEMTLSMEIADATTGEVLYRIVDKRKALDTGRVQWTNGVTNKAELERILRRWADMLRDGLDEVRSL